MRFKNNKKIQTKSQESQPVSRKYLIGIDGNEANEVRSDLGAPAGVNTYALELVKAIDRLQDNQKEGENSFDVVVYLKNPPSDLLPATRSGFTYKVLPGRGMWVMTRLTPYLWRTSARPDVMFSPSHYAPFVSPVPVACSIMDLGYLKFSAHLKKKDFWQLKYWSARSIAASKRVFAISESTRDDIVRHYPSSSDKIVVTHLAYDHDVFNKNTLSTETQVLKRFKSTFSIGQNYILYLGVLKPSKNVVGLLHGWSKIVNEFPDFTLVIGGKKGWMFQEIFQTAKDLGIEKRIIFTDYVPESDKAALISGAKLFVLPSFWEGFGLDVLNAMGCGVPVAASNVGSLPEVGGDAAFYFRPTHTGEIADAMRKVLSLNKNDYNRLKDKALVQAAKFSWEKTAKKTIETLIDVVQR